MSRKTIYVLKGTRGSESVKTSVHGSQYNADAASAEVYSMGPSHTTTKALRLIENTCQSRKVALFPISEVLGKDRPAVVSRPTKKADPTFSELFKSIEHDRRQTQREMQHLNDLIQHWMKDIRIDSRQVRAERYQTAVSLQEELRKSMHTIRQLRNECKALTYTDKLDKISKYARTAEMQDTEHRLENMAATIEELQNVIDVERRRMLKLVEESDVNRARHKKASQ